MKPGQYINLNENEILFLIDQTMIYFSQQSSLIKVEAPVNVCGMIKFSYINNDNSFHNDIKFKLNR